jgi:uncharacterized OB-fold protein
MPNPAPAPVRNAPNIGRPLRAADVTHGPDGSLHLCGAECTACGTRIFPAAPVCPSCNAEQLKPLALGATGTLYAYSTVHIAPAVWQVPYVIGYVDLPEGVRVFGKVAGTDGVDAGLAPDGTVRVCIEEDDGAGASPAAPTYHYWFAPA